MSVVVNSNISSMMVGNNLNKAVGDINTRMQRLSTGLRINSSKDDAAGLSLSQKLEAQISASDVAKSNTQTGINMLQTMDSDLSEIGDILGRMRELSVQSSNGLYSTSERAALQAENAQLISEITRISNSSKFSGINLLSSSGTLTLQIGTDKGSSNQITINTVLASASNLGVGSNTLTTVSFALNALGTCDAAISSIANLRSTIGSTINRLENSVQRLDSRKMNLQSAQSIISDTDVATESAALTKSQILQQASAALLSQANQLPSLALKLVQ